MFGWRHAYLAACRAPGFDAIVDCWGGRVVMTARSVIYKFPVSPLDYTKDLPCPILGLFGNEDSSPSPEQVNQHEAEFKKHGKNYEFHRYDGAGHGFFYYHAPCIARRKLWMGGKRFLRFWRRIFQFNEYIVG